MDNKITVDIIGARISGLSTAYYLDKLNKNYISGYGKKTVGQEVWQETLKQRISL